ncbi:hypothetical protein [Methylomonas rhizoryzae]
MADFDSGKVQSISGTAVAE